MQASSNSDLSSCLNRRGGFYIRPKPTELRLTATGGYGIRPYIPYKNSSINPNLQHIFFTDGKGRFAGVLEKHLPEIGGGAEA